MNVFQFFIICKRTNNANNATHYVKLGKKRRKSSKRNYCIISPRVIIKAIIIITKPRLSFVALRRNSRHPGACDMRRRLLFGQGKCGPQFFVGCGFWFLVCNVTTQLALQLQQERIQVERSNKVVRRLPAVIRRSADSRPNRTALPQWTLDTWMLF